MPELRRVAPEVMAVLVEVGMSDQRSVRMGGKAQGREVRGWRV